MFERSWVRILVPYTGWTFFTLICFKICIVVCLKIPKINEKEAGVGPFLQKNQIFPISDRRCISSSAKCDAKITDRERVCDQSWRWLMRFAFLYLPAIACLQPPASRRICENGCQKCARILTGKWRFKNAMKKMFADFIVVIVTMRGKDSRICSSGYIYMVKSLFV